METALHRFNTIPGQEEVSSRLDMKGFVCPIPLLKAKRQVDRMNAGEVVEIECTDPRSAGNISKWCLRDGHEFLGEMREGSKVIRMYIRKK